MPWLGPIANDYLLGLELAELAYLLQVFVRVSPSIIWVGRIHMNAKYSNFPIFFDQFDGLWMLENPWKPITSYYVLVWMMVCTMIQNTKNVELFKKTYLYVLEIELSQSQVKILWHRFNTLVWNCTRNSNLTRKFKIFMFLKQCGRKRSAKRGRELLMHANANCSLIS